jgi:threonylcarbamoyladenosine tRNA methylthiotransferase MtaB
MKVFFDTVGCRLNQAEIEEMAGKLRQAGHEIVSCVENADTVIINSCAVTAAASSDSRQKVRQAHNKGIDNIILTGCWATLYPQHAGELAGVTSVVNNLEKMKIPAQLIQMEEGLIDLEPISRKPIPGVHHRTRAFLKIQDGCDNFCTYCVTRIARGKAQSIPKKVILHHLNEAINGGVKEVVLTGVNLGSWGKDLDGNVNLSGLLTFLLNESGIERIRLSSLEPWDIKPTFFDLWKNPRFCNHLHLPLQSGAESVLHRMARKTTPQRFRELVEAARSRISNLSITTDIIVGFPGETESEFAENLDFVEKMNFSGGHVFRYSKREGTAAAKYPLQIPGKIASERARKVRETLDLNERQFQFSQFGKNHQVLWESSREIKPGTWEVEGYSENYVRVRALTSGDRWNQIDVIHTEKLFQDVLIGKIIEDGVRKDD